MVKSSTLKDDGLRACIMITKQGIDAVKSIINMYRCIHDF